MMYSNIGLTCRETLPLIRIRFYLQINTEGGYKFFLENILLVVLSNTLRIRIVDFTNVLLQMDQGTQFLCLRENKISAYLV